MSNQATAVAIPEESPLAVSDRDLAAIVERVVIGGDLSVLSNDERRNYYLSVCETQRLDWRTKPFDYIELDGKLILYANRNCTDQIRKRDNVSVVIVSREIVDGVYVVTARATAPNGRTDESIGAVALVKEGGTWKTNQNTNKRYFEPDGTFSNLRPDERANAMMKGETKAKRRVTLSHGGLSMLDESELEGIDERRIRRVQVDLETGAIRRVATIREVKPESPADGSIDVLAAKPGKRSGVVLPDGSVVDKNTGEVIQPPNTDALQERTATAIHNQAKVIGIPDQELNDVAVATFNIADIADLGELDGLFLKKLLDYARHIHGAMVTSRLAKIMADMRADPEADRLIDNHWLSERFTAKEAEIEAKAAKGQSGGR